MKKIISIILSVGLLLTSSSVFASNYPDVDETASYASAVDTLTALEIVEGDDNGLFNPDNNVTRAEFAKMTVEALGAGNEVDHNATTNFADSTNHWAKGYIEIGVAKEFINGYDDTTFGPDDNVTYAQAVKMLVAAIGYETYASQQGGWPTGYLSYGNELGIIANIDNNTALTRAQCAELIVKALKAPICKVNGYEQNYQGEWVPKYEEMNGEGKNWQTLLTTKHNSYAVKGRVISVDKKNGTVEYQVETAENFDNNFITSANVDEPITMNGYSDSLFVYSEAIVQKDKDTNEFTIISLTPYGTAKTVEFAAADIANVLTDVIEVKKENSTKTTTYKLNDTVKVYVNGEESVAGLTDDALKATNKRGTVTLVDATAIGSTATDNKYDYIMVDSYITGKVVNVKEKDDTVTITTDITEVKKITWSLVDEDTDKVTIYKDNKEIDYTEVNEDDIINIVVTDDWTDIYVSDKTISGLVTGKVTNKNYIVVDGENYEVDYDIYSENIELNTEYTLYLDTFGFVCDAEKIDSNINTGIVAGVYTRTGEDVPVVRVIEANGKIVTYEMKSADAALKMTRAILNDNSVVDSTLDKPTAANIKTRVVDYVISNDKFIYKNLATISNDNAAVEYKASTSKLDSYTIADNTTIIDLDTYFDGGEPATFDIANFENEGSYEAWIYNRDSKTGINEFVVLTTSNASLRPSSALSVVVSCGTIVDVDGVSCQKLIVNNNTEVLYENTDASKEISEGTVIMYRTGVDGYVEATNLEVIYIPTNSYADLMANKFPNYSINVGTPDSDVEVFCGPVYTATENILEIFTSTSSVNDTEAFTLAGANIYTYNYGVVDDEGLRVTNDFVTQKNSIYNNCYTSEDKLIIDWAKVIDNIIEPAFVWVRVIDNDVTDVIYFIAE